MLEVLQSLPVERKLMVTECLYLRRGSAGGGVQLEPGSRGIFTFTEDDGEAEHTDPRPQSLATVRLLWTKSVYRVCSLFLADVSRATDHKCDGGKPAGQCGQLVPEGQEAVQEPHRDPFQVSW